MKNTIYTQNREISWLRFNERVLEEAIEEDVPLFEKLKFISIFTSNLDEFFMIRVGSLYDQTFLPKPQTDNKTGMTPNEQLEAIFSATAPLYKKRDRIYWEVKDRLKQKSIYSLNMEDLTQAENNYIDRYFTQQVLPILSPQIINAHHPFPHLVNKELYVAVALKNDKIGFGIIPVPPTCDRIIALPGDTVRFILLEKIILAYAERIFENYKIHAKTVICVTRNADINVGGDLDDEDEDYRHQMKKVLRKRARLAPVRLEYHKSIHENLLLFLKDKLQLTEQQIFCSKAPLEMSYVFALPDLFSEDLKKTVTYEPFEPQWPVELGQGESILQKVLKRDIFLSYPYEQMSPFLQLIKEAAQDPFVISIKITIYRLSNPALLTDYLRMAAENGKEVTVLMELRARFDEANNINWSESLEEAGCSVIYGIEQYKVHSKLCLITRVEKRKIRYITQVGTGNYNEKTAKLYTDFSLMTSDDQIGSDAATYFKNMSIANLEGKYRHLLVAPSSMKNQILDLIKGETAKAQENKPAGIMVKINSLTDRQTIDALKEASQAGVPVRLIVRGICCLLPGIEGYTDCIQVTSIVGRFLEHSRVYCFGVGDEMKMYLSSADFMTRNLNKRVEVACPVLDRSIRDEINSILELMLTDNVKARNLRYDGLYEKKDVNTVPVDSQQTLINLAQRKEVPEFTEEQAPLNTGFIGKLKEFFCSFLRVSN